MVVHGNINTFRKSCYNHRVIYNLKFYVLDCIPQSLRNQGLRFFCIGNKNKPPAMQVCSQTALASSKKPSCYNEYKVRQPNHYNKEEPKWTIIVYHTQNGHANII